MDIEIVYTPKKEPQKYTTLPAISGVAYVVNTNASNDDLFRMVIDGKVYGPPTFTGGNSRWVMHGKVEDLPIYYNIREVKKFVVEV